MCCAVINLPGKAFEKFAHRHEVQLVGTVENDALDGESFGEILGRFGFAGASGPSGSTAEFQMQSTRQC